MLQLKNDIDVAIKERYLYCDFEEEKLIDIAFKTFWLKREFLHIPFNRHQSYAALLDSDVVNHCYQLGEADSTTQEIILVRLPSISSLWDTS